MTGSGNFSYTPEFPLAISSASSSNFITVETITCNLFYYYYFFFKDLEAKQPHKMKTALRFTSLRIFLCYEKRNEFTFILSCQYLNQVPQK